MVEYDVIEFREELLGREESPTEALKRLLNARARDGWRLKNIVGLRIAGEGLLLILERDVGAIVPHQARGTNT